jgi:hypothetical protein
MLVDIIIKCLESNSASVPPDWNESAIIELEQSSITITFRDEKILVSKGGCSAAVAEIQLSERKLCDYIDGSIDFMTVWRELAEPSPSDKTIIRKGSGAKVFLVIDKLCRCYKSDKLFKKLLDEHKSSL